MPLNNPISRFLEKARENDPDRTIFDIMFNRPSLALCEKTLNKIFEAYDTGIETELIADELLENNSVHVEQDELAGETLDEEVRNSIIEIISALPEMEPLSPSYS